MTSQHVSGLVDDLVSMAMAAKRLPELEALVEDLKKAHEIDMATINDQAKYLIDAHNAHDETKLALKRAEVARDDAEFRFLEADDKSASAVRTMREIISQAQALIQIIEPPKVEPEPILPNYNGCWLTDVPGWMALTYDQWLDRGGAAEKYTLVRTREGLVKSPEQSSLTPDLSQGRPEPLVYQSPFVPDAQPSPSDASSSDAGLGQGVEGEQDHSVSTESSEQHQLQTVLSSGVGESAGAPTTTTSAGVESQQMSATHPSVLEVSVPKDPIANTSVGSESRTAPFHDVCDWVTATEGREGVNPTVRSLDGQSNQSQTVPSLTVEQQGSAATLHDDDFWPIPSRASHHS